MGDTIGARRARNRGSALDHRMEAIVEAGVAAIDNDGPDVAIEAIATRAGLARNHLYRYFEGKAELHLAIAWRTHHDLSTRIKSSLPTTGTPLQIIRAPLTQYVSWAQEHPNLHRFLINYEYRLDTHQPPVGQSALASELATAASQYIPQLRADPQLARRVLAAIFGLIDAVVNWWLRHRDTPEDQLIDQLTMQTWLIADQELRNTGLMLDPHRHIPATTLVPHPAVN